MPSPALNPLIPKHPRRPFPQTPASTSAKIRLTSSRHNSTMIINRTLMQKTYYDILCVKEDASYEQIRSSRRASILSSHPDKLLKESEALNCQHKSGDRFIELQQAWETLSNPRSRAIYDSKLQNLRQDAVTSEDVNLEDLTVEEAGDSVELSYGCWCGDYFVIDSSELIEIGYPLSRNGSTITLHPTKSSPASVILPCGSCSLKIRLLISSDVRLHIDGHL
ncbi:hypothetical protein ACH5RR_027210 [Cinchona calisaya]|uniref:DPH4 homolog n=1 Tax=Cinchona calisaya TaxID=153742 RepID=A0ABD2Z5T7_9GENT